MDVRILVRQRADQIENAPSYLCVLDPHECETQLEPFAAGKEFHHRRRFVAFGKTAMAAGARMDIFVEEADRNAEDSGNFEEPARADTVYSFFVFLNLLKCQTEQFAQTLLTHSDQHTSQSHAMSDMRVDWIRLFLWHRPKTFR